ncbi:MAG: glycosyltransferase family 2 protein [Cyanobacteriota bacterium]|jgi:hypothetical protein
MSIIEKFNYTIFNFAYAAKGEFLKSLPDFVVPKRINLNSDLEIGITTYVDRYDTFFKPLYASLKQLFPDVSLCVAVNGFNDKSVQTDYLNRINNELCGNNLGLSRFILHDKPVGLTRLWNELISAGTCRTILILNDDLKIYPWFRLWIEKKLWNSSITLVNGTWSHFFLCKDLLDKVGWFDEDFRGIGFEDMDYTARCAYNGVPINNLRCQYITHHDHQPSRTSFDDQSSTLWGPKYSSINHDVFFNKWAVCDHNSGIYIKQINSFVLPRKSFRNMIPNLELDFQNGIYYPDRK